MDFSNFNALILESNTFIKSEIHLVLDEVGINYHSISNHDAAVTYMQELVFDLIICEQNLPEETGFSIYNKLKQEILPHSTVFFMVLEQQEKESIMLALEMGVDNVVFKPVRKDVFKRKLLNELQKKTRINLFKTQEFQEHFANSMMPMLIVEKGIIKKSNPALINIGKDLGVILLGKKINDVFLLETPGNKLNMMRFANKLVSYCKLENLPLRKFNDQRYHLVLIRNQGCKDEKYLVEIIPADFNGSGLHKALENVFPEKEKKSISKKLALFGLTKREKEIIELSSNGLPIKIIAEQLNLSKRTVEKHRSNIMEKVGANNIIEAIAAIQRETTLSN